MTWHKYFAVGGLEVGNAARAIGIQDTGPCPVRWIVDPDQCETLADALGDLDYTYYTIDSAPWYDPDTPDRSSRILGLYPIELAGLEDDTREATNEEKITDGSHLGRTRRASRRVIVRSMLVAEGRDALEAGMTWLRGVMDARACGLHDDKCGLTDFEYFLDCPPERATVPTYSSWAVQRTNLARAPRASSGFTYSGGGTSSAANVTTGGPDGGAFNRITKTTALANVASDADLLLYGTPAWGGQAGSAVSPVAANTTYTMSVWVRFSFAATVRLQAQSILGAGGGTAPVSGQYGSDVTLVPNVWTRLSTTFTTPASNMPAVRLDVDTRAATTVPLGGTMDMGGVLLETGSFLQDWFEGATIDQELVQYDWTGTVDNSTSTLSTRTITATTPVSDATHALEVDRYRRFLHSVKCVAGPIVTGKLESHDERFFANIIEFTLISELAGIFAKPRPITVAPTTPSVINDVPFNFALQPRPVNGITPRVVAIKNLEPNPSLETDATGYSGAQATVSGGSAASYFTNGRVTGELAAVGTASYRARILGNGSTSASGRARMSITVPDVTLDSADERVSLNVWAAAVSVGGATGAALVSVTAKVEWRNAGLLSTTTIGTSTAGADIAGKAWSLVGQKPPASATIARVIVEFVVDWSSSATPANNSDIRGYVDAVAVTVP